MIYAPSLDIRIEDERGLLQLGNVTAGSLSINLNKYIPWLTSE